MKSNKPASLCLPELLAPAGNLEKLKMAIHYGADAVYLGGKQLSLRAKAGNLNSDEIEQGLLFAHAHNAKVYVTVNVFAHNDDMCELDAYLKVLGKLGVDGVIVADPGVLARVRAVIPQIPVHLSTQANVTNTHAARFWFSQGVQRINLARELSFQEIGEIRSQVEQELEIFVHGALCISYSGRCMLSNYLTSRDANRGNCSHPCRFNYAVCEEKRPGQYFPVEEDAHGTYIFNSKDLCLLHLLPQLVSLGVDSLKIEGRMKSIFYVGGVVRIYRAALDYLQELPADAWEDPESIALPRQLIEEIEKTGTRGITENFAKKKPDAMDMLYASSRAEQMVEPVAVFRSSVRPLLEIRNRVECGETVEHMGKEKGLAEYVIVGMQDENGCRIDAANPGNMVFLQTAPPLGEYHELDMLRRTRRNEGN